MIQSTTCGIPFLPGAVWEFQAEACRVHGEGTPIWGEMRFTPLPRSPFRETKLECLLPYVVGHMTARAGTLPAAGLMEVVAAAVSLQKVDIEDFIEVRSGETYESLKSEFLAMHPDADPAGFFVTVDRRLLTDWTQSRSVSSAGEFIGTIAALEKVECFGEMLQRITIPLSEAELESDDSEDWIPMVVYVNLRVVEGGLQELHVGENFSTESPSQKRERNLKMPDDILLQAPTRKARVSMAGNERENLQRRAETEKLDNVIFTGRLPKKEIPDWIASSDVNLVHLKKNDLRNGYLSYRRKKTQVIAVIHNPVLIYKLSKLDYINFIELTDNYLEDIKKVFKKL